MRTALRWLGIVGWFVVGIYSLVLSLKIIVNATGFWGGLLAFILFPVTLAFAPWYAGVALNDWTLLLVTYGGGLLFGLLYVIGQTGE